MPIAISGAGASDASYSALSNYQNSSGIGKLGLSQDFSSAWAGGASDYWNKPFAAGSPNVPDYGGDLLSAPPAPGGGGTGWTFITAPGNVSYSQSADVQRVDLFGTNTPPVTMSSVGMRDLTLGEALMEGFTLNRSVQQHIDTLEGLQRVSLDPKGFVSVPVYEVFAGPQNGSGKSYGKYVIEQVEIEEQLRDLGGNATRAMVNVSLKQVPDYQVGTGIDQAGASTGGQSIPKTAAVNQPAQQTTAIQAGARSTPAAAPR